MGVQVEGQGQIEGHPQLSRKGPSSTKAPPALPISVGGVTCLRLEFFRPRWIF